MIDFSLSVLTLKIQQYLFTRPPFPWELYIDIEYRHVKIYWCFLELHKKLKVCHQIVVITLFVIKLRLLHSLSYNSIVFRESYRTLYIQVKSWGLYLQRNELWGSLQTAHFVLLPRQHDCHKNISATKILLVATMLRLSLFKDNRQKIMEFLFCIEVLWVPFFVFFFKKTCIILHWIIHKNGKVIWLKMILMTFVSYLPDRSSWRQSH